MSKKAVVSNLIKREFWASALDPYRRRMEPEDPEPLEEREEDLEEEEEEELRDELETEREDEEELLEG